MPPIKFLFKDNFTCTGGAKGGGGGPEKVICHPCSCKTETGMQMPMVYFLHVILL